MQCTFLPRNYLFYALYMYIDIFFFSLIKETRSIAGLIPLERSEIIQSSYLDVMKFHVHRSSYGKSSSSSEPNCPASFQPDSIPYAFPLIFAQNVIYFKVPDGPGWLGWIWCMRQLLGSRIEGIYLISGLLVWKVSVKVMNKNVCRWVRFGFVMIITAAVWPAQGAFVLCSTQFESKTRIMQTNCLCPESVP